MTDIATLRTEIRECTACELRANCRAPVPSCGRIEAPLFLVGEAPGRNEDLRGMPFLGMAGQELNQYLYHVGIRREDCYITNTVKCRPKDNKDPKPDEIATCKKWIDAEVRASTAKVFVAMGGFASRAFLGDVDMDRIHGIPRWADYKFLDGTTKRMLVFPMYHPALGLHETSSMAEIQDDFRALADVLAGKLKPEDFVDQIPDDICNYVWLRKDDTQVWPDDVANSFLDGLTNLEILQYFIDDRLVLSVDTETKPGQIPLTIQLSGSEGEAVMVDADDPKLLPYIKSLLESPHITTVLHHAKFDIRVLLDLGIKPYRVADSMVGAYLLQKEPQGLKALAYRHSFMHMDDYRDVVDPFTHDRFLNFLVEAESHKWPKAEEILVWEKGVPRVKKPWSLNTRLKRIVSDFIKNPDGVDPVARWYKVDHELREQLQEKLGRLTPCDLSDVKPAQKAMWYGCRDADATHRVWQYIWPKIVELGLEDTFWYDMELVYMVLDMERIGIGIDLKAFEDLSAYYQRRMDDIEKQMRLLIPDLGDINFGSPPQIAFLLYQRLKLPVPHTTDSGAPSTDDEALQSLKNHHPFIPLYIVWRSLFKNKTSFADTIPTMAKRSRLHGEIKTTRVTTGRLAMGEPNLMAIPTRTEEGRKIRDCFVARPNCYLVPKDFSQIEMRLVCHEARDPRMTKLFLNNEDIHAYTASQIFGIPIQDVQEMAHRYPAKRVGFGVLNHLSPEGLLDQLVVAGCEGWTVDKCAAFIVEWFRLFNGIDVLFKGIKTEARRYGCIRDMFGRMYLIPEMKSAIKFIVEAGERQACSYFIQGGAQGIMKRAMLKVNREVYPVFRKQGFIADPLLQIHDDLLSEVQDECLFEFIAAARHAMESAVTLTIPLEVEAKFGTNWGQTQKFKL